MSNRRPRASHVFRNQHIVSSMSGGRIPGGVVSSESPPVPGDVDSRQGEEVMLRVGFATMSEEDREFVKQEAWKAGWAAWIGNVVADFMTRGEKFDHVEVAFRYGDLTPDSIIRYDTHRTAVMRERGIASAPESLLPESLLACRTVGQRAVEVLPRRFETYDVAQQRYIYNSKYTWFGVKSTRGQLNAAFAYCLKVCGTPHSVFYLSNPFTFPRTDDYPTTCASLTAYILRRLEIGGWRHPQTLSVDDLYFILRAPEVEHRILPVTLPSMQRVMHQASNAVAAHVLRDRSTPKTRD